MKELLTALTTSQIKAEQRQDTLSQQVSVMSQGLNKMELQIGQLAKQLSSRPMGALPSQVEPNPRGKQHEQCNAISTYCSGISQDTYSFNSMHENLDDNVHSHFDYMEDGVKGEQNVPLDNCGLDGVVTKVCGSRNGGGVLESGDGDSSLEDDLHVYVGETIPKDESDMVTNLGGEAMKAMDPPRAMSTSRENHNDESLAALDGKMVIHDERVHKKNKGLMQELQELFEKVDVNVPLLDLIRQVPAYARFLKSLCVTKRRLQEKECYELQGQVSAIIQHKMPPKLKDPGSFTIGCQIGEQVLKGSLMDLGASVNVMPLSLFRRLNIGTLRPTSMTLQLADKSIRAPAGIIEDVLVRVDKFILPADFVVLDMGDDPTQDNGVPLIFGRPFMATAGVKINVLKGTVSLKVLGEKVKIQVLNRIYPPEFIKEVLAVDLVKGNSAKSKRIFGPLNPPKPKEDAHVHSSPTLGCDNPRCSKDGKPPPWKLVDMGEDKPYHDPLLGRNMKSSSPMSEALNGTAKAMNEVVGFGKKKKKKKGVWPPLSTTKKSIIKGVKACFGGENHGESDSTVNGKKVCFMPP